MSDDWPAPASSGLDERTILAYFEDDSYRWNGGRDLGTASIVSYSFGTSSDLPPVNNVAYSVDSVEFFSDASQDRIRDAFVAFERVSGLIFVEVEDASDADIYLYAVEDSPWAGWADYPYASSSSRSQVEVIIDVSANPPTTDYGYFTTLHEIGHAVGLEHPHEGEYTLSSFYDTTETTVMSYGQRFPIRTSLSTLDQEALHAIYGPSVAARGWTVDRDGDADGRIGVTGGAGADYLHSEDIAHRLAGGAGNDTLEATGSPTAGHVLAGELGNDLLRGSSYGINTLTGGLGVDTLHGGARDDRLVGGPGDDWLYGNDLNDILLGGGGRDNIQGGSGQDVLTGGKAEDSLFGDSGNDDLSGGQGADLMSGGANDDTLSGGKGADTLEAGSGNDDLSGGKGPDQLSAESGANALYGNEGPDTLDGGTGSDTLIGGSGHDLLRDLSGGANALYGQAGQDTLRAEAGASTLVGGAGADLLIGSENGADVFRFVKRDAGDQDVIRDFDPARDQIDLSATKFDADDAILEQRGPATVAVFSGKKGFEIRFVDMDRDALAAQWEEVVL